MANLTQAQKEELACTYAALILHDEGLAVTADKINTIIKAAGVAVQPFWPSLFEKTLSGKNLDDLLLNVGGGGGGAAAAPAAGGAASAPAGGKKDEGKGKKEEKKEEKKAPEPEPAEEEELGLSLFD